MATTPTKDPIPSEKPVNIKFNAGKLDEEVNSDALTYKDRFDVDRLTNAGRNAAFAESQSQRESDFSASQQDKEARFQQFLLNSGYVFLGDYELGPWQFSARNQFIRYDGQYWKLAATAPEDFATTGITMQSFEVDKLNLALIDGDTLRQELSSPSGYRLIGKCPNVTTLRVTEPTVANQSIILTAYADGWAGTAEGPTGGGVLFYDATDSTTADDGVTVFVTAGGKRWKRENSSKNIPLEWAGLRQAGDLSAPWQKVIDLLANKAKSQNSGKNLPVIQISPGEYRMLSGVKYYNMVITNFIGDVRARPEMTNNTPAIWVKGFPLFRDQQLADKIWTGGCFNLLGPGRINYPNTIGIQVGNDANNYYTKDGTGEAKCMLSNFRSTQFGIGLALTGYDCYLTSFTDFRIGLNGTNVSTVGSVIQNAGERISFINGTIWGGGEVNGGVYINNQQFDLQFYAVSFDFVRSFIVLGPSCGWSTVLLDGCHMEGFTDYVVESLQTISTGNVVVRFQNSDFLPTADYSGVKRNNSPGRILFNVNGGVAVVLDGINNRVTMLPTEANLLLSTSTSVRAQSINRMIYPSIPSPAHVMNRGASFARETVGAVTNSTTSLVDYKLGNQSGFPSLTVGTVLGANALMGTLSSGVTTGYIELLSLEYIPIDRLKRYMMTASIQYKESPSMTVVHLMRWYDANKVLISTDTYQYTMNPAIINTAALNYDEGGERRIPTFMTYRQPPANAAFMVAVIQISNIKSSINITEFMVGGV